MADVITRTVRRASRGHFQRGGAADQHPATVDLYRNGRRAALVLALCLARCQRDGPVVQGASDVMTMNDPLAERTLLMRAFVQKREDMVVARTEHGNLLTAFDRDGARAANGNLVEPADIEPISDHLHYSAAMGTNCAMWWCCSRSAPAARSAQGSSW